jgi:hypothetical protein
MQLLGWESSTYGDLRPAVSMFYQSRSRLPIRLVTAVLTEERSKTLLEDDELVILHDEAEIFRVSLSETRMYRAEAPPASVLRA